MNIAGTVGDVIVYLKRTGSHWSKSVTAGIHSFRPSSGFTGVFPASWKYCGVGMRQRTHSGSESWLEQPVLLFQLLARQVHLLLDGRWMTPYFSSPVIHTTVSGQRLKTRVNCLMLTFLVSQSWQKFDSSIPSLLLKFLFSAEEASIQPAPSSNFTKVLPWYLT